MEIKEKKVELFELFYDLVFVYAVSRVTLVLEEPVNGTFTFSQMAIYLISTLTVFQAWLFMTNYINRYGKWRWYDYLMLSINMFAAIYLSQAISSDWGVNNGRVFIASMMVLVTTVLILYTIQMLKKEQDWGAAKNGIVGLGLILILFGASFTATFTSLSGDAFYIMVAAIVLGAFLPFLTPKLYDSKIVNFPHLAERFELFTIITFGEGIVGMTRYFNINEFSSMPWTVFITIFFMFGCYVLQIHNLCNHHRIDGGVRLMFSHYFIVLAVNLITVAYLLFSDPECNRVFTASLMTISLLMFFAGLLSDSSYYHEHFPHGIKDYAASAACILAGAFIMFTFMDTPKGILYGAYIAVLGNLILFSLKYIRHRPKVQDETAKEERCRRCTPQSERDRATRTWSVSGTGMRNVTRLSSRATSREGSWTGCSGSGSWKRTTAPWRSGPDPAHTLFCSPPGSGSWCAWTHPTACWTACSPKRKGSDTPTWSVSRKTRAHTFPGRDTTPASRRYAPAAGPPNPSYAWRGRLAGPAP